MGIDGARHGEWSGTDWQRRPLYGRARTRAAGMGPAPMAHLSLFCSTCPWQRLETVHTPGFETRTSHARAF